MLYCFCMATLMEAKIKGILLGKKMDVKELLPVLKIKSLEALRYRFKHESFKIAELRTLALFLKVPLSELIDG